MSSRAIFRAVTASVCISLLCIAAPMAQSKPVSLPANTMVAIRMIDAVDSEKASLSTDYRASVDDSVVVDGVTVAPVGTPAFLRLVEVQQAGAVKGRAALSLRLVALEIDGQRVAVRTGSATIRSNSQTAKATKSGIAGALVGGLLGALAGGKAGAAQGAAMGAAVGVTAAASSGQRVRIPAETRMSFKLRPENVDALMEVLLSLEEDAIVLQKAGDKKAIEKMLADEFTMTSGGRTYSRKEFLGLIKPTPNLLDQEIESPAVQQDGDRAVLTGIAVFRFQRGTGVVVQRQKFTTTFVQREGHWFYLSSEIAPASLAAAHLSHQNAR